MILVFGEAHNPAVENDNSPSGPTVSLTPPSNMRAGDFVLVELVYRGTATWTTSVTGGQTWSSSANTQGTNSATRLFWCIFNGTWDADPVFTVTAGTSGANGWLAVFRGVNNLDPWDVDPVLATQVASTTFVIATYNTNTPNAWALVGASSADNNSWSVDNSFAALSTDLFWRSSAGTDNSLVIAQREFASAGAVGQTTMTQTLLGGDAGVKWFAALRASVTEFGQVNAHIKTTITDYAQAQAWIYITVSTFGQTQADILQTYNSFGQAQAEIEAGATIVYQHAQAQAEIKQIYNSFGQAQSQILQVYSVYAQAQADILQVYYSHGQSQAQILQTYYSFGQAQAEIGALVKYTHANANALIGVTTNLYTFVDESVADNSDFITTSLPTGSFEAELKLDDMPIPEYKQDYILKWRQDTVGTNALIVALYQGSTQIATSQQITSGYTDVEYRLTQSEINSITNYSDLRVRFTSSQRVYVSWVELQTPKGVAHQRWAQAQAIIQVAASYAHAQAQADILQTYSNFGQSQAWVLQVYSQFAQAQATILRTYEVFGQAQGQILQVYNQHGQSQALILQVYNAYGQAQGLILQIYFAHGQAQASILQTYFVHAQSQAQILQIYYQHAQAQALIITTYFAHAQAQAKINAFGVNVFGQANAQILGAIQVHAQAQAKINAFGVNAHGQSQGSIKTTYNGSGQAQALIGTSNYGFAQSQAHILAIVCSFAQAQAQIKATYNAYAQSQGTILTTYYQHANAQGWIEVVVNNYGQAQGTILAVSQGYAQAQSYILVQRFVSGQAQSWIQIISYEFGQAQSDILKLAGYGQAQGYIRQDKIIKNVSVSDRHSITLTLSDRIEESTIILTDDNITVKVQDRNIKLTLSDRGIVLRLSDSSY